MSIKYPETLSSLKIERLEKQIKDRFGEKNSYKILVTQKTLNILQEYNKGLFEYLSKGKYRIIDDTKMPSIEEAVKGLQHQIEKVLVKNPVLLSKINATNIINYLKRKLKTNVNIKKAIINERILDILEIYNKKLYDELKENHIVISNKK